MKQTAKILIVDDEKNILSSLKTYLSILNFQVVTAVTLSEGTELFESFTPDLVIIDIFLQGEDGIELLKHITATNRNIPVIMISGHADIKTAVYAIKLGAYDFMEKPVDTDKLQILIENGLKQKGLTRQIENLKQKWLDDNFIIGSTPGMLEIKRICEKAGPTDLAVLISGETGCGKELAAYYIYLNSKNIDTPYVVVNCAAVQHELFESALFGHKKGAFTGAVADKLGFFQIADSGTLFLDEIGEIPLFLQAKILRAIEYGEIQGVGYEKPVKVNTRIIAATNRNLDELIKTGGFREDLYFRLSQVPVNIPSLKSRKDDIPLFITYFQKDFENKSGLPGRLITPDAMSYLSSRDYKGNLRELRNLIGRLLLLSNEEAITVEYIKTLDNRSQAQSLETSLFTRTMPFNEAKHLLEKQYLESQLQKHHNSIKDTSAALGMLPNNLSRKIMELGITTHK